MTFIEEINIKMNEIHNETMSKYSDSDLIKMYNEIGDSINSDDKNFTIFLAEYLVTREVRKRNLISNT